MILLGYHKNIEIENPFASSPESGAKEKKKKKKKGCTMYARF